MEKLKIGLRILIAGVAIFFLSKNFFKSIDKHPNVDVINSRTDPEAYLQLSLHSTLGDLKLAQFKGTPVLLFFGYTSCPDICPTTLGMIAGALKTMNHPPIKVIFISVDPERDTVERMKEYLNFFGEDFIGATGDKSQIDKLVQSFMAGYKINKEKESENYSVDHTTYVYLLDLKGQLVNMIDQKADKNTMAKIIAQSLKG